MSVVFVLVSLVRTHTLSALAYSILFVFAALTPWVGSCRMYLPPGAGFVTDMEDMDCLGRFLRNGCLQDLPSLRTLHIAPDYNSWPQYPKYFAGADSGAWNSSTWTSHLCSPALAHMTSFIFDTPGYSFWPPTSEAADTLHQFWFGGLAATSSLAKFVLHFGYHDEAARLHIEPGHKLLDETYYTIWPVFAEESWRIPTVVWERRVDVTGRIFWAQSDDCRALYCDLGQHKYFQTITYSATDDLPSRVYRKKVDLYQKWLYILGFSMPHTTGASAPCRRYDHDKP
ncbi:hypothetical protein K438DRAFT_1978884 [Mycena galopus ATCC 62051]|nr:hypothetical protein K438DRAFT_1978884 [Mycena galopus ATCC 62051]